MKKPAPVLPPAEALRQHQLDLLACSEKLKKRRAAKKEQRAKEAE